MRKLTAKDFDHLLAPVARRRHRGMSLLEIMVVITLIGLVTAAIGVLQCALPQLATIIG